MFGIHHEIETYYCIFVLFLLQQVFLKVDANKKRCIVELDKIRIGIKIDIRVPPIVEQELL